ncbi:MAG: GNAT family N-acetyltransferase [Solirubrobacterales bacterium]|nr:GNAT family N-acetyltransferase [Solirubrobacterales bacterium]MBV9917808.1 GNAT family N-acetyltransferase [Solirubrobacterales bacterium]
MSAPVVTRLEPAHLDGVRAFLGGLPEEDVTFIKEDVRNPSVIEGWAEPGERGRRLVALDAEHVVGLVSIIPLLGWSSHVGELRLVVGAGSRGRGLGRELARRGLREAVDLGLEKLFVEVVAEQEHAIRMFGQLGFRGEALLERHIRDRHGDLRDLLVLAHAVDDEWASIASLGIEEDFGAP